MRYAVTASRTHKILQICDTEEEAGKFQASYSKDGTATVIRDYRDVTPMEEIYNSLVNGQGRQFVEQVDEYGHYDFWPDFKAYLDEHYGEGHSMLYARFTDAVILYHRIKSGHSGN